MPRADDVEPNQTHHRFSDTQDRGETSKRAPRSFVSNFTLFQIKIASSARRCPMRNWLNARGGANLRLRRTRADASRAQNAGSKKAAE
jgi:hypothetical protein